MLNATDEAMVDAAARTGDWRAVVATPGFLDRTDRVVAAVLRAGTGWRDLPAEIAAVLSGAHRLRDATDAERGLLRDLVGARHGAPPGDDGTPAPWRLRWADLRTHPAHLVVATGCARPLVAAVPLPDNTSLLGYLVEERAVCLWDPRTAGVSATIRTRGAVTAIAATLAPDGTPLLAVAAGRAVGVYDPRTGSAVCGRITGHAGRVTALCWAVLPDGRLVLVTGGDRHDGTVRLWTPAGHAVGPPLRVGPTPGGVEALVPWPLPGGGLALATVWDAASHPMRIVDPAGAERGAAPWVAAAAPVPTADRTLLAAAGWGSHVILWDPVTGAPLDTRLTVDATQVNAVAALSTVDGHVLVAAADDRTIRLFTPDPASPDPADRGMGGAGSRLTGHTDEVRALAALTVAGRTLLASAALDGTVRLWDPAAAEDGPHTSRSRQVAAVAAPDGPVLVADRDPGDAGAAGIRVRDADTGAVVGPPLRTGAGEVGALASVRTPDGRDLVAADTAHGSVVLWDPASGGQVAATPPGHDTEVRVLAAGALPGGGTLLASGGTEVLLWDPATGSASGPALPYRFGHPTLSASAWLPLPDGRVALVLGTGGGYGDGAIHVWDPVARQRLLDPLHTGPVVALATVPLPDGGAMLAVVDRDDTVWCWDPSGTDRPTITAPGVRLVAGFLLDGRAVLATAGRDRTVRLWDAVTGTPVDGGPIAARGRVTALVALPLADGRTLVAVAGGRTVVRWDPAAGAAVGRPLAGHTDTVLALTALPGDRLASGGADHTVRVWDAATGAPVGDAGIGHTDAVTALTAVPLGDGRSLLASGGADRAVRLWDPADLSARRLTGRGGSLSGLVPVPPAAVATADGVFSPPEVWLWDTGDWSGRPLPGEHAGPIAAVPMPDGRTLLATTHHERGVRLHDPATGNPVGRPLPVPVDGLVALAVVRTPDGVRLVAAHGTEIRRYDPVTGTAVGAPLAGHTETVTALVVLAGELLASASLDGTVRLWDDDRCVSVLPVDSPVRSLAARGTRLAVGCDDGVLSLDLRR
ncbi:MAG TPA: hypothetical protein VGN37_17630 [Actinocatenispora sp.]